MLFRNHETYGTSSKLSRDPEKLSDNEQEWVKDHVRSARHGTAPTIAKTIQKSKKTKTVYKNLNPVRPCLRSLKDGECRKCAARIQKNNKS